MEEEFIFCDDDWQIKYRSANKKDECIIDHYQG